jgi:hypothetical protein
MLLQSKIHSNDCEFAIIKVVAYYDVFNYPLTKKEILENLGDSFIESTFEDTLNSLIQKKVLRTQDDFYFAQQFDVKYIKQRMDANQLAKIMLPLAEKYSERISKFPFIKGVFISGGLSKNYFHKHSDIDYFIVTTKNRLWLSRTIFILYYKLLSKKKKEFFCLNYFISEADLTIPDRNQFVATEIATLMPMVNHDLYIQFLQANNWYTSYFPQKSSSSGKNTLPLKKNLVKSSVEFFFSGVIGNTVDDLLLRLTLKHWKKKYSDLKNEDFELQIRSRKHVCKHHTKGYQNKVLERWQTTINVMLMQKETI